MSDTVVSRRWVLGGVAVSTTQLCTAAAASTLAYQAVKRGLGGEVKASGPVFGNDGTLQRLALSTPLHYGETGNAQVVGLTPGSTVQIVTNSLDLSSTAGGVTFNRATGTMVGMPTQRSYLLRETFGGATRNTLVPAPNSAPQTMPVGMNLAGVNYYSANDLFLDFLKCGGYQVAANVVPPTLNANGLPTAVGRDGNQVPGSPYFCPIEDGRTTPITYRIISDGDYEFQVQALPNAAAPADTVAFPATNPTRNGADWVFTYTGSPVPDVLFILTFKAVRRPGSYVHLVRDDEAALLSAGKVCRPGAVTDLSRFACLRTLNLSGAVLGALNVYRPENYVSYADVTPLPILARIAVETNCPLWVNLNYRITDDQFQALWPVLDDLKARGLLRAVEYGNEIWNGGTFLEEYTWCRDQAMANPAYRENNQYTASQWWAGYRSAQLAKLCREAGKPYPFVIGPQPVQPALWSTVKAGRDAVPGRLVSDCPLYMSTAYCSGVINVGVTGALGAALDGWIANHDVDALLDNALNYPKSAPEWGQYSNSIVEMGNLLAQAKVHADREDMELVCYESHGHFNAQPYARNIDTYKLVFLEMYKSAVMKIAAHQILETAQAAGVKLLNWFDWNSAPTRLENGYFGTKGLPAYDALTEWQAGLSGTTAPTLKGPVSKGPVVTFSNDFNAVGDGTKITALGLTGYGSEVDQLQVRGGMLSWVKGSVPAGRSMAARSAADHSVAYRPEQYNYSDYGVTGFVGGFDENNLVFLQCNDGGDRVVWQLTKLVAGVEVVDVYGFANTPKGGMVELRKTGSTVFLYVDGVQYDWSTNGNAPSASTGIGRTLGDANAGPGNQAAFNAPSGPLYGVRSARNAGNGGVVRLDNLVMTSIS